MRVLIGSESSRAIRVITHDWKVLSWNGARGPAPLDCFIIIEEDVSLRRTLSLGIVNYYTLTIIVNYCTIKNLLSGTYDFP